MILADGCQGPDHVGQVLAFFLRQALVLADDKGQPAYKQSNMRILTGSIEICKVLKLLSMLERNAPYAAQEDPTLSSFSTGFLELHVIFVGGVGP